MKDANLKELLFKHYWAQGCFAQPEVDIHYNEGVEGSRKLITDVDVFVLRPHPELYFERILGDCRTLKGMSAISRSLWLKGLMGFVGARSGCILLGAQTPIERDHKLAANDLGITLLNESEFKVYDRCIVYPDGSSRVVISTRDISYFKAIPKQFPKLEPLVSYLYRDAWIERDSHKLIRHGLSAVGSTSGEFDPAKIDHIALLCDAAAIFSIGVAECAGRIFHQYLQPEDKHILSESLKVIIWGGSDTYTQIQNLRRRIIQVRTGVEQESHSNLELPEWNTFVQLIRHILDNPAAAFNVPRILRQMASDIIHESPLLEEVTATDLGALKLAMLVVGYLCRASRVPKEFENRLVGMLVAVQSDVVTHMQLPA